MPLINATPPLTLQLQRNLTRNIKRGHAWVYADALRPFKGNPSPGMPAILLDNKGGREIGRGYYTPDTPLALRICSTNPNTSLNDTWANQQLHTALQLRRALIPPDTSAYRLFNGEGDGLPGLVVDVYADTAVLKLDGDGAEGFWDTAGIADWLTQHASVANVYQRMKARGGPNGLILVGKPDRIVTFSEHGLTFEADIVSGQKTGFFIDQRENRQFIRTISAGKSVLNMFGYTGGFSVYAGAGGANHVTTVDLAEPAIAMANTNWALNNLPPAEHSGITADAFEFLDSARKEGTKWDLVILDPPSFAPNEASVPAAEQAYTKLITAGAQVTAKGGLLAAASCSSHIRSEHFFKICEESISGARRTATVHANLGQPADHPAPLVMEELRYLKFILMRLD